MSRDWRAYIEFETLVKQLSKPYADVKLPKVSQRVDRIEVLLYSNSINQPII